MVHRKYISCTLDTMGPTFIALMLLCIQLNNHANAIAARDYYSEKLQEYLIGTKNMNHKKWKAVFGSEMNSDMGCDRRILESLCCNNNLDDQQHLKKLGMIRNNSNGGSVIESTPLRRFRLPNLHILKTFDDVRRLKKKDKIWLNISHVPWNGDKQCKKFRVVLSTKNPLPLTALASFPRSGNTWLRYLLEGSFGIFTGSFLPSFCMATYGLFGDFVSYTTGLVSVIKTHGQFNTPDMKFVGDKTTNPEDTKLEMEQTSRNGIIVIRNPFMSLFSYRNYVTSGLFLPTTNATLFHGEDWDKFVHTAIKLWQRFYLQWILEGTRIQIVYYENLKTQKLKSTLVEIGKHLNFTIDEERLNCAIKHSEGYFHRKKACFDMNTKPNDRTWDSVYTNKHTTLINSAIQRVKEAIKKRDFDSSHMNSYMDTNLNLNYCK